MKIRHKQFLLTTAIVFLVFDLQGQKLTASAGNVSVSMSPGEVAAEAVLADNVSLGQGFCQDFYEITTMFESVVSDIRLDVYPNPTTQYLHVRKTENTETLRYSLYDLNGKLYETGEITKGDHSFDLREYPAGSFILRITKKEGQLIKTYQIVKVK